MFNNIIELISINDVYFDSKFKEIIFTYCPITHKTWTRNELSKTWKRLTLKIRTSSSTGESEKRRLSTHTEECNRV